MTDDRPAVTGQRNFVRGNEHLDRLLAAPQLAADVATAHADTEEIDRAPYGQGRIDPQAGMSAASPFGSFRPRSPA